MQDPLLPVSRPTSWFFYKCKQDLINKHLSFITNHIATTNLLAIINVTPTTKEVYTVAGYYKLIVAEGTYPRNSSRYTDDRLLTWIYNSGIK